MKHVTIKDIARELCISVSTVSRALTDDKTYAARPARLCCARLSASATAATPSP